ncbi:MAG: FecR family protein [Gracilimonas sp.]|nr:FecR family protein [Gracilimonas sp.]
MKIRRHSSSNDKDNNSFTDELDENLKEYQLSEEKRLSLSNIEVENALDNVLGQIDEDETNDPETEGGFTFNWKLMSIAATITFIGMLFALSIPVNVEVPNGELAMVELPDGTSITLNSGSKLTYSRLYNYIGRNVTLSGEGYFEVASDPDNPFSVNTLNSSVEVLGTKFNLSDWDAKTGTKAKLTVTEGSVEFANLSNNNSIVLTENESAIITESSDVILSSFEFDRMLAWLSNNIAFQNEPLNQAFGILERRFDITIDLDNNLALEDESITAFYHNPINPESIIQDICTIKGLSYQTTHNGFKISAN